MTDHLNGSVNGNGRSNRSQQVSIRTETYKDLDIAAEPLRPHILAAATIVYGDDYYNGPRETVNLSGMVQINKWPMPGFNHRIREDGSAEFTVELISRRDVGIKGFSYYLNDRVQVLSHPGYPNTGSVSQIVPGKNFPAKFIINRHGIIETANMRLVHRNVIRIEGIIDGIPPFKQPLTPPLVGVPNLVGNGAVMKHVNVVGGVNLPEAWSPADENLEPSPPVAAFFADYPGNCISMLTNPNYIVEASASGEMSLRMNGITETLQLQGDHHQSAGIEMLIVNADRHRLDDTVQVQLARMALVGQSKALDGRVMLRVSFFKVSKGQIGDGNEREYEQLRFPANVTLEAHVELVTPHGELTSQCPILLKGQFGQGVPSGATLASTHLDTPIQFIAPDGRRVTSLERLSFQIGRGMIGAEAYVADSELLSSASH